MKKKILALVMVIVLAATAVVGSSMAYLTDTDEAVNVMTLGNVDIELIEQQRNENGELEPFEDNKTLYPIVGSAQGEKDKWGLPTAANYVDKIVSVANTGASDAYIRVLVAVPAALENDDASKNVLHWNFGNRFDVNGKGTYNEGTTWQPDYDYAVNTEAQVEMDGITYNVYSFVYNKALAPKETFDATIIGFYLDENLDNEDGQYVLNGNVIDYDISKGVYIPVMAQAIQAAGFETAAEAFAASGMTTNPWGNTVVVQDTDDMREVMKTPGAKIILAEDVVIDDDKGTGYALYAKYDCTIDLNGHDLIVDMDDKEFYGMVYALNGAKVDIVGDGNVEVSGGIGQFIWCTGANGPTEVNIYGGNWTNTSSDFNTENYCEGIYANREGVINIYGGMFEWAKDSSKYTINESREGVINIYGGTFVNFDPSVSHDDDGSYVADGYKVVSETQANGDIWYTVVPE